MKIAVRYYTKTGKEKKERLAMIKEEKKKGYVAYSK